MVFISGLDDEGSDEPEGSPNKEGQDDQGSLETVLGSEDECSSQEEQQCRNNAGHCTMQESAAA